MFAQAAQGGRRSKWDQPALDAVPLPPSMVTPSTLPTQASLPQHGAGQFFSALRLPTAVVAPMLNVPPSSVNMSRGTLLDVSLRASSKPVDTRSDGSTAPAGALDAAAAAAARINAMLVAKGKLKYPPNVDIQISKMSGAAVSTRGRYMSAEEKCLSANDRPLFLSIQGKIQESVDRAVTRIKEMIESTVTSTAASHFSHSSTDPAAFIPSSSSTMLPPSPSVPLLQPGMHYVQDKVFVGLEHMHPSFDVKAHVEGPEYSYLYHIVKETGAKVHLRGRGSGFMEPSSGREAFESLYIYISHSRPEGLSAARKLCENLLLTVHAEYAAFQSRIVTSSAPLPGYPPAPLPIPSYGQMTQYYHPLGVSLPVPYGPTGCPVLTPPVPYSTGYAQPYMQYYQPSQVPPSNHQCNAITPDIDGEIPTTESTQSTPSTQAAAAPQQPQPQKRRFTEEVPEKDGRLLGYKHGPFHLTNAGAESSQCVTPPLVKSTQAACQPDDNKQERSPSPVPSSPTANSRESNRDAALMPPPPPGLSPSTALGPPLDPPKKKKRVEMQCLVQYGDSSDEDEGKTKE
uniref:KH homology domain-containing protein 4-like isoform X3 n=1 Tax=Myxine glutinosa TaxID=7769 RepID=UPI00358EF1D8